MTLKRWKKLLPLLLAAFMVLSLAACGGTGGSQPAQNEQGAQPGEDPEAESPTGGAATGSGETAQTGKILVACFSCTGNTKAVAEYAADILKADFYEITPKEPYTTEDLNHSDSSSRSSREMNDVATRPAISGSVENMDGYDTVFLGYPIWWGEAPKIISTFLESYDFSGKTIIPFCTSGSSGIGSSATNLKGLCDDSVTWLDGARFARGATKEEVEKWINSLSLEKSQSPETKATGTKPIVYMTDDISSEGLMAVYKALGAKPAGNIAIKVTTGEPPNSNYLREELIGGLARSLDGTIVECNTIAGTSRASDAKHIQVAKDHGFYDMTEKGFDLMDAGGKSLSLPVSGGEVLTENLVGANFANYDYFVVLSHFKGHQLAGYGGAIKNISIGISSAEGKGWIHSGGTSKTGIWGGGQDNFLKSMAEAGKSVVDSLNGNILYINVMNRLSVDCDCNGNPREPDMHDIGILASFDPVAVDKACVDLVKAAPDGASVMERINSRNGTLTMDHGAKIGLGSLEYELVKLDV